MKHIVTHGGQAHRDDFVSVALVLATFGAMPVYRRDPTEEELEDPLVVVLDVGEKYEPKLGNFDHHNTGVEGCTITLLLEKFGILPLARKIFVWLEFSERLDTTGPHQTAKWLGIDSDKFSKTLSPIEAQMLRMFGSQTEHPEDSYLLHLMTWMGGEWKLYLQKIETRLKELPKRSMVTNAEGVSVLVSDIPGNEEPILGLEQYIQDLEEANEGLVIGATITEDDRDDGYCIFRRNDHPMINLAPLAGREGVRFASDKGFVAKIERGHEPMPYLLDCIVKARAALHS